MGGACLQLSIPTLHEQGNFCTIFDLYGITSQFTFFGLGIFREFEIRELKIHDFPPNSL